MNKGYLVLPFVLILLIAYCSWSGYYFYDDAYSGAVGGAIGGLISVLSGWIFAAAIRRIGLGCYKF